MFKNQPATIRNRLSLTSTTYFEKGKYTAPELLYDFSLFLLTGLRGLASLILGLGPLFFNDLGGCDGGLGSLAGAAAGFVSAFLSSSGLIPCNVQLVDISCLQHAE